jgi:hypothetical protein
MPPPPIPERLRRPGPHEIRFTLVACCSVCGRWASHISMVHGTPALLCPAGHEVDPTVHDPPMPRFG